MIQKFPRENDRCGKRRGEIDDKLHLSFDKLVEMTLYPKNDILYCIYDKTEPSLCPHFSIPPNVLHKKINDEKQTRKTDRAHGKNIRMARPRENA